MGFALPQATVSPGLETISTIGPSFFEYLSFLCDLSSWRPSLLPFSIISYLWQVEVSFKRVLQILSIHPYFFFKNASFHSFLPSSPMTVYDKTKKTPAGKSFWCTRSELETVLRPPFMLDCLYAKYGKFFLLFGITRVMSRREELRRQQLQIQCSSFSELWMWEMCRRNRRAGELTITPPKGHPLHSTS